MQRALAPAHMPWVLARPQQRYGWQRYGWQRYGRQMCGWRYGWQRHRRTWGGSLVGSGGGAVVSGSVSGSGGGASVSGSVPGSVSGRVPGSVSGRVSGSRGGAGVSASDGKTSSRPWKGALADGGGGSGASTGQLGPHWAAAPPPGSCAPTRITRSEPSPVASTRRPSDSHAAASAGQPCGRGAAQASADHAPGHAPPGTLPLGVASEQC